MADDSKLIRERDRGLKAQTILDNPVFTDVWDRMDANLVTTMSNPTTPDDAVLEARRGLIVLRRVRREIEQVFRTGQMANMQLKG